MSFEFLLDALVILAAIALVYSPRSQESHAPQPVVESTVPSITYEDIPMSEWHQDLLFLHEIQECPTELPEEPPADFFPAPSSPAPSLVDRLESLQSSQENWELSLIRSEEEEVMPPAQEEEFPQELLLNKKGQPLKGAALQARIQKLRREKVLIFQEF